MERLGRLRTAVVACDDPDCQWARLSDTEHFDRHNPHCAELFIGRDGSECICELVEGHEGPHRGQVHRL